MFSSSYNDHKKMSIYIYAFSPNDILLNEIKAGIEEEGVLYEVFMQNFGFGEVSKLTKCACEHSPLGIGIGVTNDIIQIRHVSMDKPLLEASNYDRHTSRKMGANAARFVKKLPLINV